jgi:hypothetical protein
MKSISEFVALGPGLMVCLAAASAYAAPAGYSASLRLVDQPNVLNSAGAFHVDFAVVPEPASVAMALIAGLGFVVALASRRRRA